MAKKIWRHTLSVQEQKLWDAEGMKGWREALERCVEDDAREQGCTKYMIFDRQDNVLAKDVVEVLPEPEPVA